MTSSLRNILVWLAIALSLLWCVKVLTGDGADPVQRIAYTELLDSAKNGLVESVYVVGERIDILFRGGERKFTNNPGDAYFVSDMVKAGVRIDSDTPKGPSGLTSLLLAFGPVLLLVGAMVYFAKAQAKRGGMMGGFGKAKANRASDASTVTFADIAGCDEAKEEVKEVVDFLRDPKRFQKLGGRIPKGLLMVGPPGTGKTLLARAIAGEAKVPFLAVSGSDFVEMFVGVGASRVRDLFEQAKKSAPCIVFMDEIDSIGRHRGSGSGGGNDEREQTLNQMLVEMDGFEANLGVIVVAATNRPDILDKALTRPGRFDRQVVVGLPDLRGREQILGVHLRKVPAAVDVDATVLARGCTGFSGADLANLVNEAALFAARRGATTVAMEDFERAKDKILMGPERRSMVMPEEERRNTAYHEAGHALVARLLPKTDPVHKVTIVPRGRALGVTMQLPTEDRYSTDKVRLENMIAVLYGGRIAEELFMGQATTGASNDFERATAIARNMVTRWGYSDVLGPMVLADNETDPTAARLLSDDTLKAVDDEIRGLLKQQYSRVTEMLKQHADKMHVMAQALLEWETIDADQIEDVMNGVPVRSPKSVARPRGGSHGGGTPVIPARPAVA
jgi:cell division protease FtsH